MRDQGLASDLMQIVRLTAKGHITEWNDLIAIRGFNEQNSLTVSKSSLMVVYWFRMENNAVLLGNSESAQERQGDL